MKYEIVLSPEAVDDLRRLKANERAAVQKAIEAHLRHQPTRTSKSRIKRLRGLSRPQYRLRVDEVRIFYDVTETSVEILAIVSKAEADQWLKQAGEPDENSSFE
ncbi:MAG: type II toxin-antitoxin system RelE/ParE family toxin [Anaerolineales bacterium]|nr:type II toxin-antitoxin system RelE/ParE family toxin [Anaerolineales bacterium]